MVLSFEPDATLVVLELNAPEVTQLVWPISVCCNFLRSLWKTLRVWSELAVKKCTPSDEKLMSFTGILCALMLEQWPSALFCQSRTELSNEDEMMFPVTGFTSTAVTVFVCPSRRYGLIELLKLYTVISEVCAPVINWRRDGWNFIAVIPPIPLNFFFKDGSEFSYC